MSGKLLIALLGVSCNTDSTDDLAIVVANQHAAAFGKDLIAGGSDHVLHEQRPFFSSDADERRRATQGKSGVCLAVSHLEAHHRGAIFLLKRFNLGAGLDDDDTERAATQFAPAEKNSLDNTIRLFQLEHDHTSSVRRSFY